MRLQFVGSGDAFGSGGRFNTCFHVTGNETNFLIDCGASSAVALNRASIDVNAVDLILISHFHGDHFGGVPFFILNAQLVTKRTRPLVLAGPRGLAERHARALEVAFPSYPPLPKRFPLTLVEIEPGTPQKIGALQVKAFPVVHSEAAGPCLGYRIETEGRVIAYSGDTEWTETLVEIGREADLFICECYVRDMAVKGHLSLTVLERNLDRIRPKRLVLTHMSGDMLDHLDTVRHPTASDGLVVEI
ncbi:MAG TPA: MBL fold metallo-hydrolase [Xanthobacteraceae bacterium]|nr:MBL fold metallo-hydrolase [Xanthobacteraceae bacterium]